MLTYGRREDWQLGTSSYTQEQVQGQMPGLTEVLEPGDTVLASRARVSLKISAFLHGNANDTDPSLSLLAILCARTGVHCLLLPLPMREQGPFRVVFVVLYPRQ